MKNLYSTPNPNNDSFHEDLSQEHRSDTGRLLRRLATAETKSLSDELGVAVSGNPPS